MTILWKAISHTSHEAMFIFIIIVVVVVVVVIVVIIISEKVNFWNSDKCLTSHCHLVM